MITLKGNSYTIRTLPFDMGKCLEKNGKPVVLIPDEFVEDFIQLLTHAGAAARFLDEKTETNLQTNKTNENEKETKN